MRRVLLIVLLVAGLAGTAWGQDRGRHSGPITAADVQYKNALFVTPDDFAGHGSLQGAVDWWEADATTSKRKVLYVAPGNYTADLVLGTDYMDVIGMGDYDVTIILSASEPYPVITAKFASVQNIKFVDAEGDEYLWGWKPEFVPPKIYVPDGVGVIAFETDDNNENLALVLYPILNYYGMTTSLNTPGVWSNFGTEFYKCTPEEMYYLIKHGSELWFHSLSHYDVPTFDYENMAAELLRGIQYEDTRPTPLQSDNTLTAAATTFTIGTKSIERIIGEQVQSKLTALALGCTHFECAGISTPGNWGAETELPKFGPDTLQGRIWNIANMYGGSSGCLGYTRWQSNSPQPFGNRANIDAADGGSTDRITDILNLAKDQAVITSLFLGHDWEASPDGSGSGSGSDDSLYSAYMGYNEQVALFSGLFDAMRAGTLVCVNPSAIPYIVRGARDNGNYVINGDFVHDYAFQISVKEAWIEPTSGGGTITYPSTGGPDAAVDTHAASWLISDQNGPYVKLQANATDGATYVNQTVQVRPHVKSYVLEGHCKLISDQGTPAAWKGPRVQISLAKPGMNSTTSPFGNYLYAAFTGALYQDVIYPDLAASYEWEYFRIPFTIPDNVTEIGIRLTCHREEDVGYANIRLYPNGVCK